MPTTIETKEERRDLLRSELENMGLSSFEDLERNLDLVANDGRNEISGEEASLSVNRYLERGYPRLDMLVKVLRPIIRQCMLQEQDCWIEEDPRFLSFVEGSGDYPDVKSVKMAVFQVRSDRRAQLAEEFQKHGLPPASSCSGSSKRLDDVSVDFANDYIDWNWDNGIGAAAQGYIIKGVGHAELIAYAAAVESRRKELLSDFCEKSVKIPCDLSWAPPYRFEGDIGRRESRDIICEFFKETSEKLVLTFLLGEAGTLTTKDVVEQIETEQTSRLETVRKCAAEFSLDLEDLKGYHYLFSELDSFVDHGTGDGKQIVATIALEEQLRKLSLPGRKELFRESSVTKARFDEIAGKNCSCVLDLVQGLAKERDRRRDEVTGTYLKAQQAQYRNETYRLSEKEGKQIEKSNFALFGSGSIDAAVASLQELVRRERLQKAMSDAALLRSSSGLETDKRLLEFIQGQNVFSSEVDVVSTLREEEVCRTREIQELLDGSANSVIVSSLPTYHPIYRYIAQGVGSAEELVSKHVKEQRERLLRDFLDASEMAVSFYRLSESPQCQDFLDGNSDLTCDELVASLVDGWESRKQNIKTLIEECGEREESLRRASYDLFHAVNDYVELGSGDLKWIAEAIKHHSWACVATKIFGGLKAMLPSLSFSRVTKKRKELEQNLAALAVEVVNAFLCVIGGEPNLDATMNPSGSASATVDISHCISTHILSFCKPSYDDAARFGMSTQADTHQDHRLVLLLTKSRDCPWKTAGDAVTALRRERRMRIEQFDREFPRSRYTRVEAPSDDFPIRIGDFEDVGDFPGLYGGSFRLPTDQEKEDNLCEGSGPRAKYVDGKISLKEAIDSASRLERAMILREALSSASLHPSLVTKNECCDDFVNGLETKDGPEASLERLVAKLQDEKAERIGLLEVCFSDASIVDTCDSTCGLDDGFRYADEDYFPGESSVRRMRFQYIEVGQGKPEGFLRAFVMNKRMEKLKRAIDKRLNHRPGNWMRRSKKCKGFVANTEEGIPSRKEIEDFMKTIEEKLRLKENPNDAGEEGNGDENNDERSSCSSGYGYDRSCLDYYERDVDEFWS